MDAQFGSLASTYQHALYALVSTSTLTLNFVLYVLSSHIVFKASKLCIFCFQVIQVKQLIGSMFGDGQRAAVASRLVLERDAQTNGLVLLDSPATNFIDVLQQCFSGVPLVGPQIINL